MKRLLPGVRAVALGFLLACSNDAPARAQWEVFLATDAPIPQFGDEVLVEVLDGNPTGEQRFIDASSAGAWPISFGVAPADPASPVRLHVRFFRLSTTGANGLPSGESLIEATASLPVPSGVTKVVLPLVMRCFGVSADLVGKRSCDPATGALAAEPALAPVNGAPTVPSPGSWPPAATVGCRGSIPSGMVCVPGGTFLMGNPTFPRGEEAVHDPSAQDPVPERLVQLRPFALDAFEVTVGTVRQLLRAHPSLGTPALHDPDQSAPRGLCTYLGPSDPSADALPANCLSWSFAEQACALLGKRLPTEAEWEFAARNRTRETPYPWGTDPDVCNHAVVGRGLVVFNDPSQCETASNGFAAGPVAGGAPRDRTALGIANLGGNLEEWVEDRFNAYSAPCWSGASILVDPICKVEIPDETGLHSVRGGSWVQTPNWALGYMRNAWPSGDPSVGFRCALSR